MHFSLSHTFCRGRRPRTFLCLKTFLLSLSLYLLLISSSLLFADGWVYYISTNLTSGATNYIASWTNVGVSAVRITAIDNSDTTFTCRVERVVGSTTNVIKDSATTPMTDFEGYFFLKDDVLQVVGTGVNSNFTVRVHLEGAR